MTMFILGFVCGALLTAGLLAVLAYNAMEEPRE